MEEFYDSPQEFQSDFNGLNENRGEVQNFNSTNELVHHNGFGMAIDPGAPINFNNSGHVGMVIDPGAPINFNNSGHVGMAIDPGAPINFNNSGHLLGHIDFATNHGVMNNHHHHLGAFHAGINIHNHSQIQSSLNQQHHIGFHSGKIYPYHTGNGGIQSFSHGGHSVSVNGAYNNQYRVISSTYPDKKKEW